MELIKNKYYEGYYYEDILKMLGDKRGKEFDKWFSGQTGAIHEGKLLVYRWDYERFLAGLPVID